MRHSISLFLLVLFALPAAAQRLPRTVIPDHYDLTFAPDFSTEKFSGDETIEVSVQQPTREVVLHAVEIEFHEATITSGGTSQKATVTPEPTSEWARLSVAEPLAIGPATIHIRYTGLLNRKLRGLYLGEANGRKYASTQMEATDARAAFPSFDEPEMKATFAITSIIDKGDAAISNGAEVSDTPGPGDGKHTIRFATTPRMSTYLVAITIGDFKCLSDEVDGIPLRICGTPEKLPFGHAAMDATKAIMTYYNEYYGIKYPFGKLDQIGVADFRAGAMENAGAILYRDAYLFVDVENAPAHAHRGLGGIIAHEMAHMWFGDLVTMRWWDDIWLNEGFATWITNKPLAKWKPEWKLELREVGSTGGAISADSLETSRKIRQQADTPDEIDELFDGIAYGKAAAVLRMIESFIGEEKFRQGVNAYLADRAYGNATFHDFAEFLQKGADAPVAQILESFVEQPGVPVLRASSECRSGETWVTVEQERFFLEPGVEPETKQLWTIPVCFTVNGERRCELVTEAKQTLHAPGCGAVYLNARGRGYYLVEPSRPLLDALMESRSALDATERMALVRDEWNLVRSGRRPVGDYLRLAGTLQDDDEPLILTSVIDPLEYVRDYVAADSDRPRFEEWIRNYLQPIVRNLGWTPQKGESDDTRALRAAVLYKLGKAGNDPVVLREARQLVDQNLSGKRDLDPELTEALLSLAAAGGDRKLYERYLEAMRASKSPDEYYRYFYALSEFRDPALVRRTLDFALSPEVKNQDAGGLLHTVVANPYGREAGWSFLEERWSEIEKKMPERMLGRIMGSGRVFCDPASLERVKAFYAKHPIKSAARTTAQSLERVGQCIALREKQSSNLHAWLASDASRSAKSATSPRERTRKQRR